MDTSRDLDYKTVQWVCIGCPFLHRHTSERGKGDGCSWGGMTNSNAYQTYSGYYCGAPKANFKQQISQETSVPGGAGWCPMFAAKWDLLNDKDS
jgi:hypothetical protein